MRIETTASNDSSAKGSACASATRSCSARAPACARASSSWSPDTSQPSTAQPASARSGIARPVPQPRSRQRPGPGPSSETAARRTTVEHVGRRELVVPRRMTVVARCGHPSQSRLRAFGAKLARTRSESPPSLATCSHARSPMRLSASIPAGSRSRRTSRGPAVVRDRRARRRACQEAKERVRSGISSAELAVADQAAHHDQPRAGRVAQGGLGLRPADRACGARRLVPAAARGARRPCRVR